MPLPGLFVVGTDTGVGKTVVASAIARVLAGRGHRVGVLKPLATGATPLEASWRCEDTERLIDAVGGGIPFDRVTPFVYEPPVAPPVAARRLGNPLEFEAVRRTVADLVAWWTERAEVLIVEGVGGFLTPIAEGATVADLAILLDYPLVIVARRTLGTLNHTLLTVECALRRGLRVAAVVLNSPEPPTGSLAEETNAEELARHLEGVTIVDEPWFQDDVLQISIAEGPDDWYDRIRRPRGPARPGEGQGQGGVRRLSRDDERSDGVLA